MNLPVNEILNERKQNNLKANKEILVVSCTCAKPYNNTNLSNILHCMNCIISIKFQ